MPRQTETEPARPETEPARPETEPARPETGPRRPMKPHKPHQPAIDKTPNMAETQFHHALRLIDEAHAQDPKKVTINGIEKPYELHYAQKMSHYLEKRCPAAPEPLRLAIRAQHFRRWEIPRDSYPMTKPGYHAWRTYLKKRQAEMAAQICVECGYGGEDAERVASMIRKDDFKKDEETQILEDVACLVFLDDQFEEFEKEHDEEKIVTILKKTWGKMSEKGHELALEISMSDRAKSLITKALST